MDDNKSLIIIKSYIKDVNYIDPKEALELNARTIKSIKNAFNKAILDKRGWIWIEEDSIHSLLRVKTKSDARYWMEKIPQECKRIINNKEYIRGYTFIAIINKFIEEKGSNKYLPYVNSCYNAINSADLVKLTRIEYDSFLKEEKRKLKIKRIKKYDIKVDELTGEEINKRTCEFSHIRSVAMYQEYSDNIENGLIVNKNTHDEITMKVINDEEQLYDFCLIKGWHLDWYDNYKKNFMESGNI